MKTGIEYLTSSRYVRYPFADDSVLSVGEDKGRLVFGCFLDAMIQLKGGAEAYISGISVDGATLSFSLCQEGQESVRLTCTRSSKRYPVVSGECDWCWYSIVLSADGIREMGEANIELNPDEKLPFASRCIGLMSNGVTSLVVYDGTGTNENGRRYTLSEVLKDEALANWRVKGDVALQEGYNAVIETGPESMVLDGGQVITIGMSPGAGAGVVPCWCDDNEVVYKTPGLICDDGHVRIFNDTCYDLQTDRDTSPGIGVGSEGFLKIHEKCKACCTCEMYATVVNDKLIPMKDSVLKSRETLENTYTTYEKFVKDWNERLVTALPEDIIVSMTAVPLEAAATNLYSSKTSGKMSRCGFSISVRNSSFVDIVIKLAGFYANGRVFEDRVNYMKTVSEPIVDKLGLDALNGEKLEEPLEICTLPPGRSLVFTYFVRLEGQVTTDRQTGFITALTFEAWQGERRIVKRICSKEV